MLSINKNPNYQHLDSLADLLKKANEAYKRALMGLPAEKIPEYGENLDSLSESDEIYHHHGASEKKAEQ